MAADGKVDYAGYTTAQLKEALSSIDQSRFPLNFSALHRELSTREVPTAARGQANQELRSTPKTGHKRPVLVWIILVFYALLIPLGAVSLIAATRGAIKLSSEVASYYQSFGFWDYLRVSTPLALGAAMVVALFRMRRAAFYFAAAAFLFGLAVNVLRYDALKTIGYGPIQAAVGFTINGLLVFYLWRLLRKGVLA